MKSPSMAGGLANLCPCRPGPITDVLSMHPEGMGSAWDKCIEGEALPEALPENDNR